MRKRERERRREREGSGGEKKGGFALLRARKEDFGWRKELTTHIGFGLIGGVARSVCARGVSKEATGRE